MEIVGNVGGYRLSSLGKDNNQVRGHSEIARHSETALYAVEESACRFISRFLTSFGMTNGAKDIARHISAKTPSGAKDCSSKKILIALSLYRGY